MEYLKELALLEQEFENWKIAHKEKPSFKLQSLETIIRYHQQLVKRVINENMLS